MRRFIIAIIAVLGVFAVIALALSTHPAFGVAALPFLPFVFGGTHSTLSDETDSSFAIAAISVVGAVNGATLDMQGWEGVLVTINLGVIVATGTLDGKLQSGAQSNASDMADVAASNITQLLPANSGSIVQVSLYRPTNRYVRVVLTQATAGVTASVTYTRFRRSGVNPGTAIGQAAQSPIQIIKLAQN